MRQGEGEDYEVFASREVRWRGQRFAAAVLAADDIEDLLAVSSSTPSGACADGDDRAFAGQTNQVGAILLGSKLSGKPYRTEDLDYLDDVSYQVATMIEMDWQQEARTKELEASMETYLEREKSLQQQMQQL